MSNSNYKTADARCQEHHCRFTARVLFGAILFCQLNGVAFGTDAIDRLTPERLEAVHLAVKNFASERRARPRQGSLKEFRANLHVHSAFSHDSRGTIEEIVSAAKKAGTQILMFTEHPADHYEVFEDGHQGLRDGVLLIPGAETNGMLVFPRQRIREFLSGKPQELSMIVRDRDGLTFLSHLEERMDWDIDGLTGVEIYNTHADVKGEKRLLSSMKNPLWLLKTGNLIRQYPQEAFSALLDYPADYLKRWDQLCAKVPHTGVSANDAHQNIGLTVVLDEDDQVRVEDGLGEKLLQLDKKVFAAMTPIPDDAVVGTTLFRLRLDSYENSLRHVATHLLMSELSQPAVWQSLNNGHAFVAFDWIADATGFDFALISAGSRHEMGSIVKTADSLKQADEAKLVGQAPLPGHWKLIRNGQLINESDGGDFEFRINQPGIYRTELWLNVAGEQRIWILSNPVYVIDE